MWFQPNNKISPSPGTLPLHSARHSHPHSHAPPPHLGHNRTYTQTTITRLKKPPNTVSATLRQTSQSFEDESTLMKTTTTNNSTLSSMFMCASETAGIGGGGGCPRATTPLHRPVRLAPLLTASAVPFVQSQSQHPRSGGLLTRHRIAPLPLPPSTSSSSNPNNTTIISTTQQPILAILPKTPSSTVESHISKLQPRRDKDNKVEPIEHIDHV
jgi:hypothetical protein